MKHLNSNVATIILTKNEESDLPGCLESLNWCDELHVVDSGSSDGTVGIAKKHGAKTYENSFVSFGTQRNWALENCDMGADWVLFLDADERSTESFSRGVIEAVRSASDEIAGFFLCNKLILMDRWLKRTSHFPTWQFRLLRRGRATFTDFGHGQKEGEVNGKIEYLPEPYLHYPFSKGWHVWWERHNRYSEQEAHARFAVSSSLRSLRRLPPTERNAMLRATLSRVPGWPALRFFYGYFGRLGFLEGRPGFILCLNWAIYEYMIRLKMKELERKKEGKSL